MALLQKDLNTTTQKILNETTGNNGLKLFGSNADKAMKEIIAEMTGQKHYGFVGDDGKAKYKTIEEYLNDSPNGDEGKKDTGDGVKLEEEFNLRKGSYYNAFGIVITDWFYNLSKQLENKKDAGWEAKCKGLWEDFDKVRNINNDGSAKVIYGDYNAETGGSNGGDELRSWGRSTDGGTNPLMLGISANDAIKKMAEWSKATPTKPIFDKSKINTFKTEIENRIKNLFSKSDDQATFKNNLDYFGRNGKHWAFTETWEDFLDDSENAKKPEEEFKTRKDAVLYVMAEAYLDWYLYDGRQSNKPKELKQILKAIKDYQTKYKEDSEKAVFDAKKNEIKELENKINKISAGFDAKKEAEGVKNAVEARIDKFVPSPSTIKDKIQENLSQLAVDDGKKITKKEDGWVSYLAKASDEDEFVDRVEWVFTNLPKVLIDYWIEQGTKETEKGNKKKWWDNYIVEYYQTYTSKQERYWFEEKSYSKKIFDWKATWDETAKEPTDKDGWIAKGKKDFLERVNLLYSDGGAKVVAVSEVEKAIKTNYSSTFKTPNDKWDKWLESATSDTQAKLWSGELMLEISVLYITSNLNEAIKSTDPAIAKKYFEKVKEYRKKYGLEYGVQQAFNSWYNLYDKAEKKVGSTFIGGMPTGQIFSSYVVGKNYSRYAGKAGRFEKGGQPRDDTGTQNYYKSSETSENK